MIRVLAIAVPDHIIGGPFCVYVEKDDTVVASHGCLSSAGAANLRASTLAAVLGGVVASCPYRPLVDSKSPEDIEAEAYAAYEPSRWSAACAAVESPPDEDGDPENAPRYDAILHPSERERPVLEDEPFAAELAGAASVERPEFPAGEFPNWRGGA